jgi:hypothetical protein
MTAWREIQGMQRDNLERVIPYGVQFFDDATGGILPGQLIVIGAATGVGKTDLLTKIARSAAKKTRVCMYALEAHRNEIQERIFYEVLSDVFFALEPAARAKLGIKHLNFVDFHVGRFDKQLEKIRPEIEARAEKEIENIEIVYATEISGEGLALDIDDRLNDGFGLFILDHLHHLELDEESNEVDGLKRNMKLLNKITNGRECALLTASHLRKADRYKPEFPSLDDLHGSSEISKRAHVCILLGPAPRGQFRDLFGEGHSPTLMQIGKFRLEGARRFYFACHGYSVARRNYTSQYVALKQVWDEKGKQAFELLDGPKDKPGWAKFGKTRGEL